MMISMSLRRQKTRELMSLLIMKTMLTLASRGDQGRLLFLATIQPPIATFLFLSHKVASSIPLNLHSQASVFYEQTAYTLTQSATPCCVLCQAYLGGSQDFHGV
jgi:hypothetical protein